MIPIFLKGLTLGGSLIIAIGAQNAFVLSQGVRKKYNLIIPFICSISDAVLISIGVMGVGSIIASNPLLANSTAIGGALFLFWYGLKSLLSFFKSNTIDEGEKGPQSLKMAVITTLGITLLNPHVYIDTILLLGGISGQFDGAGKYVFGAGAITASFLWFFTLSLGGRFLSPLFKEPLAWKILDLLITAVMWSIAFSLVKPFFI
ncbi:MAG: amino acid transporter [Spirochaetales bacterium]|nr:amino acid transporter [Spirochaetales bacterium]